MLRGIRNVLLRSLRKGGGWWLVYQALVDDDCVIASLENGVFVAREKGFVALLASTISRK